MLSCGFDLDGAIVYASYREELRALTQASAALLYEYPARLAMLRALRRHMTRADAARFVGDAVEVSFESLVTGWRLYPDTLDTLAALRDDGVRLGCISNGSDGASVWRIIDRCALRAWFSPIYISVEVCLRKPHPRMFEMALEQSELSPRELAVRFTDEKRYFVSEATVYRLLKAHDLITSPTVPAATMLNAGIQP